MGVELSIPYLSELSYLAIPIAFVLLTFGVIIAEELVLLAVGYAIFMHVFDFWSAMIITIISAVLTDISYYYIGTCGHGFVKKSMNTKLLARVQHAVNTYGMFAVFFVRFIPGMRFLTPWVAGSVRMHFFKFVIANAFGTSIQTPIIVGLGVLLGSQIDKAVSIVNTMNELFTLGFLVIFVFFAIFICLHRKQVRDWLRGKYGT